MQAGPLKFAEWREAIDENDPASQLIEAEDEHWESRLTDARAALRLFVDGPAAGMSRTSWDIARNVVQRMHDDAVAEVREARGDEEIPAGRLTLADALGLAESAERRRLRVEHFRVFLRFIAQGVPSRDLGSLLKNFLALARKVMPGVVGGMSQVEMASLIGESKQAVRAREERVVELFCKQRGVQGFHMLGHTASEETRQKLAESQKGNTHRKDGTAKKKAMAAAVSVPAGKPKQKGRGAK